VFSAARNKFGRRKQLARSPYGSGEITSKVGNLKEIVDKKIFRERRKQTTSKKSVGKEIQKALS